MRHVPVVLALAIAGIHCSAEATPVAETTRESEIIAPEEKKPLRAPSAPLDEGDAPSPEAASKGNAPIVTSTATDGSGATYAAGTFTGSATIGGLRMKSRGEADVFVVKISAAGTPLWARSIGSPSRESAPRVTVEADTGRVTVIGMTAGEMDCGSGPLPTFAETFFLCTFYGPDGTSIASASFPTGRQ